MEELFFPDIESHGVNGVRQAEIHAAEPLLPEPRSSEVELAIENLKGHKSPSINQIPTEFIKARGKIIRCKFHKHIISIWQKAELPEEWKESIIVPIYKKGNKINCVRGAYYFASCVQNFIQHPAVKVNSIYRGNY